MRFVHAPRIMRETTLAELFGRRRLEKKRQVQAEARAQAALLRGELWARSDRDAPTSLLARNYYDSAEVLSEKDAMLPDEELKKECVGPLLRERETRTHRRFNNNIKVIRKLCDRVLMQKTLHNVGNRDQLEEALRTFRRLRNFTVEVGALSKDLLDSVLRCRAYKLALELFNYGNRAGFLVTAELYGMMALYEVQKRNDKQKAREWLAKLLEADVVMSNSSVGYFLRAFACSRDHAMAAGLVKTFGGKDEHDLTLLTEFGARGYLIEMFEFDLYDDGIKFLEVLEADKSFMRQYPDFTDKARTSFEKKKRGQLDPDLVPF